MTETRSSLKKEFPNRPANTLSFIDADDTKTVTEKERKTEKSVRFAPETESVSDDQSVESLHSSGEVITWVPSEQLYSEDTFISETATDYKESREHLDGDIGTPTQTDPSYGTSTFIDLDSADETRTASDYSYTDSFASSGIFSPKNQSEGSIYREWKDITEIVKDIEELEESEFVTRADSIALDNEEDEATDISEFEDEEAIELAKQNFLLSTIRRLKLQDLQSPRSLAIDSPSYTESDESPPLIGPGSKEKAAFCGKMIDVCKNNGAGQVRPTQAKSELYDQVRESKNRILEEYGLSSAIVDKLRLKNLQHRLDKKAQDIEEETKKSLDYVQQHQHVEEEIQRQKFISQMTAQVQHEKMEECIQAHLIKMHPVKWFADFVNGLPSMGENSREILYKYKRQVEQRMENDNG